MKKIMYVLVTLLIILIGVLIIYTLNKKSDNKKDNKNITTTKVTTKKDEEKDDDFMDGITINYHASIRIEKNNMVIYFDPYKITDALNDADYIFITHSHYDHYSEEDIKKVMKNDTKFVVTSDLENKVISLGINEDNVMSVFPDKSYTVDEIKFNTISSYNTNKTFHKKSYNWVGYVINLDGIKYYVVGDSDVTEELRNVKCDVMFIPVGGTYTMTDEEAAEVVNEMNVKYAVPIHYGVVGSRQNAENFVEKLNDNVKGVILK